MKKYATAATIGCRLNQADTALILDKLRNRGFDIAQPNTEKKLSLIIINTCSVTGSASQKSRQTVRSLRRKHPDALIIITGCSADIESVFWENEPFVDLVIPNNSKTKVDIYLDELEKKIFKNEKGKIQKTNQFKYNNSPVFIENGVGYYPFKSRANIKIQEGCNSFCTYCIVPYGRGKPRSRNWNDTIREFEELLNRGHQEIVLTGVNIITYNDNGKTIVDLLEKLVNIQGDFRIRLSSTEPQFSTPNLSSTRSDFRNSTLQSNYNLSTLTAKTQNISRIIDIMSSSPKICRFLHLPLQHGTNYILRKMGRNYTSENFTDFVNRAVSQIPGICVGTDIIVGFPGETESLFSQCTDFIKQLPLSYLHVFRYSKRKGTPASEYENQVPHNIALERHNILSNISNELSNNFIIQQLGKTVKVLFEKYNSNNKLVGWSDNYIKIKANRPDNKYTNFTDVQMLKVTGSHEVQGKIVHTHT